MRALPGGWPESDRRCNRTLELTEATETLQEITGIRAESCVATTVGGSSFSRTFRVPSSEGLLFLKLGDRGMYEQYTAEVDGLQALSACDAVTVPGVVSHGTGESTAFLFLEWLELGSRAEAAESRLGSALASQHRDLGESFGWRHNNFIGAMPQPNTQNDDWLGFWRDTRLGYQIDRAVERGLPAADQEACAQVVDGLDNLFGAQQVAPSLLHGDLWSGNWGALETNTPCLFDPAVYYGDREADLAMTRLFGGFGSAFYDAYQAEWPLPEGWESRVDLYNLYHLLNHFNLFGSGYLGQVRTSLARLIERC